MVQIAERLSAIDTHSPLQIAWSDDLDALKPRKDEWNALVARSETNTVFQTYEWHASWWHAFGEGAQALVLLAEVENVLVGIAPLVISKRRVLGRMRRVVEFIGSRASDYCDVIVDRARPEVLPLLLQWLLDRKDLWDLLLLANIPNEVTVDTLAGACGRAGLPTDARILCNAPSYRNTEPEVARKQLNKGHFGRTFKTLKRQGELKHEVYSSAEDITAELDRFFQQHIRRRAVTDTPSKFLDARWQACYQELVQTLGPQRSLVLMATRLDSITIAFDLCFEYGNRLFCYDRCFDIDYAQYSVGKVALRLMLEYVIDHALDELDFGRGDEPYKLEVANYMRVNREIKVYHTALSRQFDRILLRAIARIEGSSVIGNLGRRLIGSLQDRRWGRTG